MADVQVSYYDLTRLNNQINATLLAVQSVHAQNTQLQNQVNYVDQKVERVDRELVTLWSEFRGFVKVQANRHNVDMALAKITHVRQELEQKFRKHQDARIRLRGILDAADTELLREHTIELCSEQLMLDTPKYWLSPCLVALAAWIGNNEELATKAVKIALDRDAEKTTLLWALICRRTVPQGDRLSDEEQAVADERQKACLAWLSTYFAMQDPLKMKSSVIVLIDAWAREIFGKDTERVCQDTFEDWMDAICKSDDHFQENQEASWSDFFQRFCVSTKESYPKLAALSPEFAAADAYLMRIRSAGPIQHAFDKILYATIDDSNLIDQLDAQLERLISEFDPEEEAPRVLEAHYALVDECKGDIDRVENIERRRNQARGEDEVSFARRLEDAVKTDDPQFAAARQTAIKEEFLGRYIASAYEKYITEKKDEFPEQVTFVVKPLHGWRGLTRDGQNGDVLKRSLKSYLDGFRNKAIADAKATTKKTGFLVGGIISAAAGLLLGLVAHWFFILIGLGLGALFFYNMYNDGKRIQKMIDTINANYDKLTRDGIVFINNLLAEWLKMLEEKAEFEASDKNKLRLSK